MVNQLLSTPSDPNAIKVGDKVNITGTFTVGSVNEPTAYIAELGCMIATKHLKKVG
jgi:hypothetical protein